jgi:glycosidase
MYLIEEGQNQSNTIATKSWWRNFYAFQKNLDPGLMTVGEVWTSTSDILPYADQRLDYCFEFDLSYAIINAVKSGNPDGLKNKIQEVVDSYPSLQYGTFLTNHDQNRVIEELGQDMDKAKLASGILLTLPGVPYMYYGEEVGMRGVKPDEDIRRPMQWSDEINAGFTTGSPWRQINSNYTSSNVKTMQGEPNSLWNRYRKLIHIRSGNEALKRGDYKAADSNAGSVMAYLRTAGSESVLVVHSFVIQPAQGVTFSIGSSSMQHGTYTVTELLSGNDLGTLVIDHNGGFNNFTPMDTLAGMTSYLMKMEKQ